MAVKAGHSERMKIHDTVEMKGLRKILWVSWRERKQMSGFLAKLEYYF